MKRNVDAFKWLDFRSSTSFAVDIDRTVVVNYSHHDTMIRSEQITITIIKSSWRSTIHVCVLNRVYLHMSLQVRKKASRILDFNPNKWILRCMHNTWKFCLNMMFWLLMAGDQVAGACICFCICEWYSLHKISIVIQKFSNFHAMIFGSFVCSLASDVDNSWLKWIKRQIEYTSLLGDVVWTWISCPFLFLFLRFFFFYLLVRIENHKTLTA